MPCFNAFLNAASQWRMMASLPLISRNDLLMADFIKFLGFMSRQFGTLMGKGGGRDSRSVGEKLSALARQVTATVEAV